MVKLYRKKKIFLVFMIIGLFISSSKVGTQIAQAAYTPTIAHLVFKTSGGGVRPDYGLYIASDLRKIGIEVDVIVEEWSVFVGTILLTYDFDLVIIGLSGGGASPDLRDIYTENGSLNMFGLGPSIPYNDESEYLQNLGVSITDPVERREKYVEWQILMMDKILPLMPMFAPRSYVGTWANLKGYDISLGIANSLPYMYYDGFHENQVSLEEFRVADVNWRELNPLFIDDTSSKLISELMAEPIVQFSPNLVPTNSGLVYNWEQVSDNHFKFYIRDNIFWNPSYNVTERTAGSPPLDTIMDVDLMKGLKYDEFSNGTNQQVTAKDAVFTYLAWSNPIVSEDTTYHEWISDCYVDSVDELAFHIHIDGNPDTPEIESYTDFWARLPWNVLPEFFLNSTDGTISHTAGGVECVGFYPEMVDSDPWVSFSTSAFGCGKYMFNYSIPNSETVLTKSPYWMNIGSKNGETQYLDIDNVVIRVIPDISAELAEFKAGHLEWTDLTAFPTEREQCQQDARFDVQNMLQSYLTFMAFNLRRPFIGSTNNFYNLTEVGKEEYNKGVAVRKAITYAINRSAMNEYLHDGQYFMCHSVIYPSTAYYYYDGFQYECSIEKAQEWLAAAGYYTYPTTPGTTTNTITTIDYSLPSLMALGVIYIVMFKFKRRKG